MCHVLTIALIKSRSLNALKLGTFLSKNLQHYPTGPTPSHNKTNSIYTRFILFCQFLCYELPKNGDVVEACCDNKSDF